MAEPRSALRRLLELLGLCALAITQPVLETFGNGAEEFVFRDISAIGIVLFALVVLAGPALVVWLVEQLVLRVLGKSLGQAAADMVHVLAVYVGVAAATAQIVKGATSAGPVVIGLFAVVFGALAAAARYRASITSLVLALMSLFGVVALGLFLFGSPVADVLFDDGTATAARVDPAAPAPVVLVVLDELPTLSLLDSQGQIDAQRWPNFARLGATSTWFRNASSVAPSTPTAVPALLSGRYPTDTAALPVVDEHPQNLFTMLAGSHDFRVHESVTRICPETLCGSSASTGSGFASFVSLLTDATDIVWQRTNPGRSTAGAVDFKVPQSDPRADANLDRWLERIVATDRPSLDVIHTILPHQPWWRLPSGQRYGRSGVGAPVVANGLDPTTYSWTGDFARLSARSRHLLQLEYTDTQLGKVLDQLERNGTFDESLVIVTADHGVSFDLGEPIRGLSGANAAEVMWIPMFIKQPGQRTGALDERPAETIDIVPTIADVLDFDLPWPVDGVSMFGPGRADDTRRFADWRLNARSPTNGIMVELDGASEYERLLEIASTFPVTQPDDDWTLYRFGPYGDLVGQSVDSFAIGTGARANFATLNEAERYDDVDPNADEVPAYISGTSDTAAGSTVVVALNGTIVGWSEVTNDQSWWTVVPSSAFMTGPNEIALYEVRESDPSLLTPIVFARS